MMFGNSEPVRLTYATYVERCDSLEEVLGDPSA